MVITFPPRVKVQPFLSKLDQAVSMGHGHDKGDGEADDDGGGGEDYW